MSYAIGNECIICGMCAEICPVGAIVGEDESQSIDRYKYVIDESACVECAECFEVCPAQAIVVVDALNAAAS